MRQMNSGQPALPLDRDQFVERLLEYRRLFHTKPRVKVSLIKLAPLVREDEEGAWEGTCQLRMWGEKAPGSRRRWWPT